MFILLDRGALKFICKHPSQGAVCDFAHIEGAHTSSIIFEEPGDTALDRLTDLELHNLYENTTGEKLTTYYRPQVLAAVAGLLPGLPVSDISPLEVQAQALSIPMGDKAFYKYVKGSYTPARPEGLFTEGLRTTAGALPPVAQRTTAANPVPHTNVPTSVPKRVKPVFVASTRETQNGVSKYKDGTGGATIWAHFDRNPSISKEQLDKIAEDNGWNKTSVSIVFRQWKKFHNVSN